MGRSLVVCTVLLFLFLTGCMGARNIYRENPVGVETLTLSEVQESPRQVTATLKGYTGVCVQLGTRQRREGKTFYLRVVGIYEGPADVACPAVAVEYTQTVTLDLYGFEAGVYTIRAGSLSQTFSVPAQAMREALVDRVEIALLESDPVQVVVTAEGSLGSGCQEIGDVNQRFEKDTFFITVLAVLPWALDCTPVAPPFSEKVTLETADLAPGTYKVNVNGVVETFAFP